MLNISQIRERIKELDIKHYQFFKAANSNTLSFVDIDADGRVTFKTGILIDSKVWQDIKDSLHIVDEKTDATYNKNPKEASNIFHSIMKASVSKDATNKKEKDKAKPKTKK